MIARYAGVTSLIVTLAAVVATTCFAVVATTCFAVVATTCFAVAVTTCSGPPAFGDGVWRSSAVRRGMTILELKVIKAKNSPTAWYATDQRGQNEACERLTARSTLATGHGYPS
jgi:hypothetical protein